MPSLNELFGPSEKQPTALSPNRPGLRGVFANQAPISAQQLRFNPQAFQSVAGVGSQNQAVSTDTGPPIDPQQIPMDLSQVFAQLGPELQEGRGAGLFEWFRRFGQRPVGSALRNQVGVEGGALLQAIADIFRNRDAVARRRAFLSALLSSSPTFTLAGDGQGPINPDQLPGIEYTPPTLPPPPSGAGDPGGTGGTTTTPPTVPPPPTGAGDPGGIGGVNVGDPRPPGSVTTFPSMPTLEDRMGIIESLGIPPSIRTMSLEERQALRDEILGPQMPFPAARPNPAQTLMDLFIAFNEDPVPRPPLRPR